MRHDEQPGRYECRSATDDSIVVYDTENDDAWIRSDTTAALSWMD